MLDWYTLDAIERHKELIREVEQYSRIHDALQSDATTTGVRVRLLAHLGHWMVEHGHRLEVSHELSSARGDAVEAC